MKLSEMRELLSERGIQLTKSLGQNFLHDGNQLRRIVGLSELTKQDKVLEIGPGLGPLTELLLAQAGEVLAIEKDARLVEVLQNRFKPSEERISGNTVSHTEHVSHPLTLPSPPAGERVSEGRVRGQRRERIAIRPDEGKSEQPAFHLVHDDALEFLRREPRDWSGWKLVANLPYSVASPILVELAQMTGRPERMVVTLQIEVAQRLMAKPGDKYSGVLTLFTQLDYEPRDWFKIPASCFFPEPDVDSACVVLVRREQPLLASAHRQTFVKIVKRSFSQRRKMMLKLLRTDWPEDRLLAAFNAVGIPPQTRAEAVGLELFVSLTQTLASPTRHPESP